MLRDRRSIHYACDRRHPVATLAAALARRPDCHSAPRVSHLSGLRIEVTAVTQAIVRVTDDADRAQLEQAIAALRFKQQRMPAHWDERRQQVADEIDVLVDRWIAAAS